MTHAQKLQQTIENDEQLQLLYSEWASMKQIETARYVIRDGKAVEVNQTTNTRIKHIEHLIQQRINELINLCDYKKMTRQEVLDQHIFADKKLRHLRDKFYHLLLNAETKWIDGELIIMTNNSEISDYQRLIQQRIDELTRHYLP